MSTISSPRPPHHNQGDISVLQNNIAPGEAFTFEQVRAMHQRFQEFTDGQLHVLALDAGFDVTISTER